MKVTNPLQAVVLTGSRPSHQALIRDSGMQSKVLLPLQGKPMLAYVLDALSQSTYQPSVTLSGDAPELKRWADQRDLPVVPSGADALGSVLQALTALPGDGAMLFVSGDHPLLTATMLDGFLEQAMGQALAGAYAVVPRRLVQRDYPQSQRSYVLAKGEAYSGGNLLLINRSLFKPNVSLMEVLERNRKRPWRNACHFDIWTALRFLLRQLDLPGINRVLSRQFGCVVGLVEVPDAACCMDVDKPSDLALAERILAARGRQEENEGRFILPPEWRNIHA